MRRNEVWWAELPASAGPRPVVILTRDSVLDTLDSIVVALVTRSVRELPSEVRLGRRERLTRSCDRQRMLAALGSMGDAATDHLLRIAADAGLLELVRSALPHALASTGDARALPVLLSLPEGANSDGRRIASVLALGHLVRRIDDDGHPCSAWMGDHAPSAKKGFLTPLVPLWCYHLAPSNVRWHHMISPVLGPKR